MPTGSHLTDRIAGVLPEWAAWPASALSTVLAFAGAVLILWATAFGNLGAAVWSGISFVLAALLWHVAEFASDRR